jgi:hypothetical protein
MFKSRLHCLLAFAALPLIATAQFTSPAENSASCVPQAYVPNLFPFFQTAATLPDSAYSKFDETGAYSTSVMLLVAVAPDGKVVAAEALSGPDFLRETATGTVRHFKYPPVIRNGQAVCALVSASIPFRTPGRLLVPQDYASDGVGRQRLQALEKQFPRSPQQVFLDTQQARDVPGGLPRTLALPTLAKAALAAGEWEKAVAYAQEGLDNPGGTGGQCIFDCNMVLGEVALHNGDVPAAARYLVASGKPPAAPL